MNILVDQLPEAVEIGGEIYDLNTDFRVGIEIMLVFEDPELTQQEKMIAMVCLLYPDPPSNLQQACELGVKFLNCGECTKTDGAGNGDGTERLYSFEHDAKYIYSAIKQSHGVDIETVPYLHWWKFSYMFLDLKEDCQFSRILQVRQKRAKGQLTKEDCKAWLEMADILELPQYRSEAEQEAEDEFMRLLKGEKIDI